MFDFFKRRKTKETTHDVPPQENAEISAKSDLESGSIFTRLKAGLKKTRSHLNEGFARIFQGQKEIDAQLLQEIEAVLLTADVGLHTTKQILSTLTDSLKRNELKDPETLFTALKQLLLQQLTPVERVFSIQKPQGRPFVILVVGVNGAGKTTTIGKLAHQFQNHRYNVMLAAGDTFRAAAIEQLQTWGDKFSIPVIAEKIGGDSASVMYRAMESSISENCDVLIADTAGRLHTSNDLIEEMKKIKRVLTKFNENAPDETWLVIDACNGQNALQQVKHFHESIGLTGLIVTKLDGTAKGGILFRIANEFQLPIYFIGVGEKAQDLQPFLAHEFVDALFE